MAHRVDSRLFRKAMGESGRCGSATALTCCGAQGRSGLGLDAQRDAVMRHVASHDGELVADFCEIESGKRSDRPQLAAAIAAAKKAKATLIIAKLDRLARSVHFISGLMESSVDFVAADNPHANKLMVHLLAAFAEHAAHA
jgi:DNA invertase Pin-like site-specific DNA recombinase